VSNNELLTAFINALNGKDGAGSHLVSVPPGPHLSDALISSPVIQVCLKYIYFLYNFVEIKIFSDFFPTSTHPFIPSPLPFHLNILYPDVICVVNLNTICYIIFHFLLHLIILGAAGD